MKYFFFSVLSFCASVVLCVLFICLAAIIVVTSPFIAVYCLVRLFVRKKKSEIVVQEKDVFGSMISEGAKMFFNRSSLDKKHQDSNRKIYQN